MVELNRRNIHDVANAFHFNTVERILTLMMSSGLRETFRLLRIPESIATPCSVKAWGSFLVPPHIEIPNLEYQVFLQLIKFFLAQLKHEIGRETSNVPFYSQYLTAMRREMGERYV